MISLQNRSLVRGAQGSQFAVTKVIVFATAAAWSAFTSPHHQPSNAERPDKTGNNVDPSALFQC